MIHPAAPTVLLAGVASYLIRLTTGKSFMSNAITNNFIYQFLFPLIVLTEGFNMRKRALGLYAKEVAYLGIIAPLISCVFNALALILLQNLVHKYTDWIHYEKLKSEILVSIAIVMSTVELHGSVAPLHTVKNMRLYKILFGGGTFNNNISLVLIMTFERMIHEESFI